jgi:hypothetical protein
VEHTSKLAKFTAPSEILHQIDERCISISGDLESLAWYNAPNLFATSKPSGDSENVELSMHGRGETNSVEENGPAMSKELSLLLLSHESERSKNILDRIRVLITEKLLCVCVDSLEMQMSQQSSLRIT